MPRSGSIWTRIGDIDMALHQVAAAKIAYQTALQLDPGNKGAMTALARMK